MIPMARRAACLRYSLIGLLLLSGTPAVRAEERRNQIVAVVNNDVITAADVEQAMAPLYDQYHALYGATEVSSKLAEAKPRIVTMLVEERVMLQEAKTPRTFEVAKGKYATPIPITVSAEEIADAVAEAQNRFPSETEFLELLKSHHMTLKDLEARYRDQITVQKLIGREVHSRIVVSPSEITAYYQAHMDEYRGPEAARLSNILVRAVSPSDDARAKTQAQTLWQQLKGGADFAELARKNSQGPNAEGGGMLGWVERGRLMPEIDRVVFTLQPGELSPIIKSALGYHILRVEDRHPPRTKPIFEVQSTIREKLYQDKYRQRYAEWMGKLKERAYITIKS